LHLQGGHDRSTEEPFEVMVGFDVDFRVSEGVVAVEQKNLSQIKALFI